MTAAQQRRHIDFQFLLRNIKFNPFLISFLFF